MSAKVPNKNKEFTDKINSGLGKIKPSKSKSVKPKPTVNSPAQVAISTPSLDRQKAIEIAYSRGYLAYKLYPYQTLLYQDLWAAINNKKCLKYVLNCSRRWGKSTVLCLVALEYAFKYPNSQIRFAAPTGKALKKITTPIFKMLLTDCPADFKPTYKSQENVWEFPNGSSIHCAGTDNGNYESLRGTASNLNIVDEAGFADELEYVVKSVLIPQTLTTGGKTLLASTPPKTPAHDFYQIAMECEAEGFYKCYTIYDNKTLTLETIDTYAKEAGGVNSSTFQREYLAKFVVDTASQLIPEFSPEFIQPIPPPTPESDYYHRYTSMDLGVRDFTAVLFGHYNFKEACLYIEDELTINGHSMTTDTLKDKILLKEKELFKGKEPYRRISDNNNLMLLQDLGHLHGLHFNATTKESLNAMVNEVRIMVGAGRIKIDPKCEMLLGCLKYGVWDKNFTQFARSSVYKHFDHLAALVYLVRNLDKSTNPVPTLFQKDNYTYYIPDNYKKEGSNSNTAQAIRSLFNKNN